MSPQWWSPMRLGVHIKTVFPGIGTSIIKIRRLYRGLTWTEMLCKLVYKIEYLMKIFVFCYVHHSKCIIGSCYMYILQMPSSKMSLSNVSQMFQMRCPSSDKALRPSATNKPISLCWCVKNGWREVKQSGHPERFYRASVNDRLNFSRL